MNVLAREPWAAQRIRDANQSFKITASSEVIAYVPVNSKVTETDAADLARRIVACVNACAGSPTEQLEEMIKASDVGVLASAYDVCSILWEWHGIDLVGDHPIAGSDAVESLCQVAPEVESVVMWARENGRLQ